MTGKEFRDGRQIRGARRSEKLAIPANDFGASARIEGPALDSAMSCSTCEHQQDTALPTRICTLNAVPVLLAERDVATILGVSVKTLRNWRISGRGPPFLKLGCNGLVRYDSSVIVEWLSFCACRSTS